jgi:hypothetical protein
MRACPSGVLWVVLHFLELDLVGWQVGEEGGIISLVSERRVESWYGACTGEGEERGFSFGLLVGVVSRESFAFFFLLFDDCSMGDMQKSRSIG